MVRAVQLWADGRGFLHASQDSAEQADVSFERESRRAIVAQMLIREIEANPLPCGWDTPSMRIWLADWLITHWPAMRAIGFAYRVHELGPDGESAIGVPTSATEAP